LPLLLSRNNKLCNWSVKNLQFGPYNFGFLDNPLLGNWVEHLPYQDGMLVYYWDTSQSNNNTRQHPGAGLVLPGVAHPMAMIRADGGVWRNRMQTYDSTFTLAPTDPLTLDWLSQPSYHPSLTAVSIFDDRNSYFDPANPWGSVIVPNTGTQIRLLAAVFPCFSANYFSEAITGLRGCA